MGHAGAAGPRVAHARPLRVNADSVESPVDVDLCRGSPWQAPSGHMARCRARIILIVAPQPAAGHSDADGLRGAHARPLRRQPAGRPGTGKMQVKMRKTGPKASKTAHKGLKGLKRPFIINNE